MVDYLTEIKDELIDAESYFNNIYSKYEDIVINSIEDYYEFKANFSGEPIYKMYNRSRDLNPSEITFEIEADPNPQVVQLFESNPELANAVYSKLLTNSGLSAENLLSLLEKENIVEKDCTGGGKLKAEKGLITSFTKGSQWEIVKDLKGYPSHAQGGIDIKLDKDGFSFARGEEVIKAAHGLVLPKIK